MTTSCYCGANADGLRCEAACSRRFCLAHSPIGLCSACELEFLDLRDRSHSYRGWKWAGRLLPWLILLIVAGRVVDEFGWFVPGGSIRGFSTGIPLLDLAIIAAVVSVVLGGALAAMRANALRRSFIGPGRNDYSA